MHDARPRTIYLLVSSMLLGYAAWILPRVLIPGPVSSHFPLLIHFSTDPERAKLLVALVVELNRLSFRNPLPRTVRPKHRTRCCYSAPHSCTRDCGGCTRLSQSQSLRHRAIHVRSVYSSSHYFCFAWELRNRIAWIGRAGGEEDVALGHKRWGSANSRRSSVDYQWLCAVGVDGDSALLKSFLCPHGGHLL